MMQIREKYRQEILMLQLMVQIYSIGIVFLCELVKRTISQIKAWN